MTSHQRAPQTTRDRIAPNAFRSLLPFGLAGIAWLIVAATASILMSSAGLFETFLWTFVLWALSMLDLFAMAKAIFSMILALSKESDSKDVQSWGRMAGWGGAKLAGLAAIGILLIKVNGIPSWSLMLGLSTLVVVPLVGGFWWSQKELKYA